MDGPSFVIGNIAKGDDLWDRDDVIEDIWKVLGKGNVLLKAPRRFGKSSIMYRLYEEPRDDFVVVFEDTEGISTPLDFVTTLLSGIHQHETLRVRFKEGVKRFLKKAFSRIDEVGVAEFRIKIREEIKENYQEKGVGLLKSLGDMDEKIVLVVDELPVLIQRIEEKDGKRTVKDFLHWFRQVRQSPGLQNLRWVVGGSIGIEHILKQMSVGTKVINDFEIVRVEPFSEEDAKEYIRALLKNEGKLQRITSKIVDKVIALIGAPVPYFIQIVLKESIHQMRRQDRKTLTEEMMERAYYKGALGPASRTYFEHYFTRLSEYYDEEKERIAKRLILEVARQGEVKKKALYRLFNQACGGRMKEEVFSYLMTDLENDFYVTYDTEKGSYSFSTNILRDWWLRYYDLVEE